MSTKEDVVVADDHPHLFEPTVPEDPPDEPPREVLRRTFEQVLGPLTTEQDRERLVRRLDLTFGTLTRGLRL